MKLSILTCVLGEPEALIRTFESVAPFLGPNLGWTVKFSTDSSEVFIERFRNIYVSCHRSSDVSLYDAMNQGLELLNSDYYFVIGAGDEIVPTGVQCLLADMASNTDQAAYFAPVLSSSHGLYLPAPSELRTRMSCPHPGAVLNSNKSREIGGYDFGYKIAADYDHLCRYVQKFGTGMVTNMPLVNFAAGGMSEVRAFEGALEEELIRMRVWRSHEFAVKARLLRTFSMVAASLFDQVAQLHTPKS
jgi:hypothetical protein